MSTEFDLWLQRNGLGDFVNKFSENGIDFDVVGELTDDDLKELGLGIGFRKRFLKSINSLEEKHSHSEKYDRQPIEFEVNTINSESDFSSAKLNTKLRAERRQTTLMFCDLVGSTTLADRIDPEDLSEIFKAYREKCFQVVHRLDVRDIRTIGDGLLITFGYPQAHEDDPQRAVSAGLAIIENISVLSDEYKEKEIELKVRIGIHTGLVVVEDADSAGTKETEIVGMPAHVAARIQGLAEPNSVFVSSATNDLVKNNFKTESMGLKGLKGVRDKIEIFRVISEANSNNSEFTPLIERELRQKLLFKQWEEVTQGSGRVVLIQGEAGIGKTRLIRALKREINNGDLIEGTNFEILECRCTEYYTNSPLHPIVDLFERSTQIELTDTDETKLEKLEKGLNDNNLSLGEFIPLLAPLLSIPLNPNYKPINLTAQGREVATRSAIVKLINQLSAVCPVLFIVEDLHWIDPSTRMILDEIVEQGPMSPICAIFSFRPKGNDPFTWNRYDHVSQITLNKLSRDGTKKIAQSIASENLSSEVLNHIIDRTDGVPLYIEELTKMLLEAGELERSDIGFRFNKSVGNSDIPKTLDGPLIARLDMLGAAKLISQQASTLGRSFSYRLLSSVFQNDQFVLNKGLDQLVEAEILYRKGQPPESVYYFKHSLIQDAAYKTLLIADRKKYHAKIAKVLEEQFSDITESTPELVAHHYSNADQFEQGVYYWQKANIKARKQAANNEALAHIENGLHYVEFIEDKRVSEQRKIELLLSKGLTLTALEGYAAPEVQSIFSALENMINRTGQLDYLFSALRGLQMYYLVKGPLSKASLIGEKLLEHSERAGDIMQSIEANRRLGWCLFCLGKINLAQNHLELALSDYQEKRSQDHILLFGSDPAVIGYINLAWTKWFLELDDEASTLKSNSILIGRKLGHPLSLAYALGLSAVFSQWNAQPKEALELADETIQLAEENYLPYWIAMGKCLKGWATIKLHPEQDGLNLLSEGISRYRETGAEMFLPYLLTLLAGEFYKSGNEKDALNYLDEAIATTKCTESQFYLAESYRLKSEILVETFQKIEASKSCLQKAQKIALKQGAKKHLSRIEIDLEKFGKSNIKTSYE